VRRCFGDKCQIQGGPELPKPLTTGAAGDTDISGVRPSDGWLNSSFAQRRWGKQGCSGLRSTFLFGQ